MTRCTRFLVLGALVALAAAPASAQVPVDTLRVPLYHYGNAPQQFVPGATFARASYVRVGPDSAPASTANADSIVIHPVAIKGYTMLFDLFGSSSASNAKSVVITFVTTSTNKVDSLQMKSGGGTWHSRCVLIVRNPVPTTDSTQVFSCSHLGSADSSTTSTAAPTTITVKMIPGGSSNYIAVHNATGTAKGDVIVQAIRVESLAGGRVNP